MFLFSRVWKPLCAEEYRNRNQPTIIWWNLKRFGEAIGELIGAGAKVDSQKFTNEGVSEGIEADEVMARAKKLIAQAGEEYKALFLFEYKRLMMARLGLRCSEEADFQDLFTELLDILEALELDYNHFFRRLSSISVAQLHTENARKDMAGVFLHKEGVSASGVAEADARQRIAQWLGTWRNRILEDWGSEKVDGALGIADLAKDEERMLAMQRANPSFIPRNFILDEVIRRVEKGGERDVLRRVMHMALHPFEKKWHGTIFDGSVYEGDLEEEARWTGDVPKFERAMQCSCSS